MIRLDNGIISAGIIILVLLSGCTSRLADGNGFLGGGSGSSDSGNSGSEGSEPSGSGQSGGNNSSPPSAPEDPPDSGTGPDASTSPTPPEPSAEPSANPPEDKPANIADACASFPDSPERQQFKQLLNETLSKPYLCKATLLSVASFAQLTCHADISKTAFDRMQNQLEKDLEDPPTCPIYTLQLAEVADSIPDSDKVYAVAVSSSMKNILNVLDRPDLCIRDYLQAAELADMVGDTQTYERAMAEAKKLNGEIVKGLLDGTLHAKDVQCNTGPEYDSCNRTSFEATESGKNTESRLTVNFTGHLKDRTFYSYMTSDAASAYTFEGQVNWTYAAKEEAECFTSTATGSGESKSKDAPIGYFTVESDGKYEGSISVYGGEVTYVTKKKTVLDADGKDKCEGTQGDVHTEQIPIGFSFEGTTSTQDRTHGDTMTGQQTENTEGDPESDVLATTSTANWLLETPPC